MVNLGETSELKLALNRGIASLVDASKEMHKPHRCLNGEGVGIISQIARNPDSADTSIYISSNPIISIHDGLWLNVYFFVFLGQHNSDTMVSLTPRQTSYIICNLPEEHRQAVVEMIKSWYVLTVKAQISRALEDVDQQMGSGDLLQASAHDNRVLDIHHDEEGLDVPYTEWYIVGSELFVCLILSQLHRQNMSGYTNADNIIRRGV